MDEGGSVTLVFYKLQDKWWKEPTLNLLAAACQMSSFTHVELAIGSDPGAQGQMSNVCRVFNDAVGMRATACISSGIAAAIGRISPGITKAIGHPCAQASN
jgi:hypothetical protein